MKELLLLASLVLALPMTANSFPTAQRVNSRSSKPESRHFYYLREGRRFKRGSPSADYILSFPLASYLSAQPSPSLVPAPTQSRASSNTDDGLGYFVAQAAKVAPAPAITELRAVVDVPDKQATSQSPSPTDPSPTDSLVESSSVSAPPAKSSGADTNSPLFTINGPLGVLMVITPFIVIAILMGSCIVCLGHHFQKRKRLAKEMQEREQRYQRSDSNLPLATIMKEKGVRKREDEEEEKGVVVVGLGGEEEYPQQKERWESGEQEIVVREKKDEEGAGEPSEQDSSTLDEPGEETAMEGPSFRPDTPTSPTSRYFTMSEPPPAMEHGLWRVSSLRLPSFAASEPAPIARSSSPSLSFPTVVSPLFTREVLHHFDSLRSNLENPVSRRLEDFEKALLEQQILDGGDSTNASEAGSTQILEEVSSETSGEPLGDGSPSNLELRPTSGPQDHGPPESNSEIADDIGRKMPHLTHYQARYSHDGKSSAT
ncbi:uncharacterized protein VTP21DRAFT_10098 [Calcarisporiella thermophila]|uniref:uncharacterized protein n=1 Tax=Calcarisporiella thermophila TaxID=911321 RepID=UPI003743902B